MELLTLDAKDLGVLPTTAPTDWQVLSDDTYIYVFRSISLGTGDGFVLLGNRYLAVPQASTDKNGELSYYLHMKTEARYKESQRKDTPASLLDKPSYQNEEGEFFIEPSLCFSVIRQYSEYQNGYFAVLLTPSAEAGRKRWLFITKTTGSTGHYYGLDLYSWLADTDGWPSADTSTKQTWGNSSQGNSVSGRIAATLYQKQEETIIPEQNAVGGPWVMIAFKTPNRLACIDFPLDKEGIPHLPAVAATLSNALRQSGSIQFDGINDSVSIPLTATLSDFTVECWVYNVGGEGTIIALGGETSAQFGLCLSENGTQVRLKLNGPAPTSVHKKTYTQNQWHHYAVTYTSSTSNFIIYKDGVKVGTKTGTGKITTSTLTSLFLGTKVDLPGSSNFEGCIDELRLWNGARTASDIKGNMSKSVLATSTNLLGYWIFDQTELTDDSTTNSQTAILDGAHWSSASAPIFGIADTPDLGAMSIGMGVIPLSPSSIELLNGADGLVHLYVTDSSGKLYACQFDTKVSRAIFALDWKDKITNGTETGNLFLAARETGPALNQAKVSVKANTVAGYVDITLDSSACGGAKEVFLGIPNDLTTIKEVINGQAME